MAISQEQQKRGLEHLKQIRRKYFSKSSEAAEWWDNLTPEWRGVVLHAAAVTSGTGGTHGRNNGRNTDLLLRWFTGYVERSQPAENGFQRLFIRELVGVFERMWPCSFQHPTLREVASWLEENFLRFWYAAFPEKKGSGISIRPYDFRYPNPKNIQTFF